MKTCSTCLTLPCALALAMMSLSGETAAQFIQQGNKLVGTGAVGYAWHGSSVALSSDGNTAIVGGFQDNGGMGAAWVYTRTSGVWSQQGTKLVGTGALGQALQGRSVSLSSDGNTAIVGGYGDNGGAGAAWVYTRLGSLWFNVAKLVGMGAVGNAFQGMGVALSSDGNTAMVGGFLDSGSTGAVWVFTRSGGVWSQEGAKLVGTDATMGACLGWSVSLSSDGNTAIAGGFADNSYAGAAWVFTRSSGAWTQQGNKLVGTGAVGNANQGQSVALSSDGNTAMVGGFHDSDNMGAAWVFTRSGGVWSQQGAKLVGTGAVGPTVCQGSSVSLSSDGNTALVAGYCDSNSTGAAWVYRRSGSVWSQGGNKLIGTGAVGSAYQGYSVSLSSDGNTAIVGGPADNSDAGAAWIFTTATVTFGVAQNWNLVSVPMMVTDYRKTSVYPSSVSAAYAFDQLSGYARRDTLKSGLGYWLKFDSSETVTISGFLRNVDTVGANYGWNILGSISFPVPVDFITQNPPGMVVSDFFGYNETYAPADTLYPGKGYWVKAGTQGSLILSSEAVGRGRK